MLNSFVRTKVYGARLIHSVVVRSRPFTDVRQAVRRRESRSHGADIEATEGEDTGHHRQLHQAVPGVRGEGQEEDQNVPEELSEEQTRQGGRTLGCGEYSKF